MGIWIIFNNYVLNTTRLPLSRVVCRSLEGTIPHLVFSIEIQSNNLTYQDNPYTKYQQFLYILIKTKKERLAQ